MARSLVLRIPLEDTEANGVADGAQGAFSVGSPSTWQRVAENGGSLEELVFETLAEAGIPVAEDGEFAYSVEG